LLYEEVRGNCAVKHKVATWTGYALLSDGPRYACRAIHARRSEVGALVSLSVARHALEPG